MKPRLLIATVLALLGAAAPAHADSIAYNLQGDLWLAYADGSHPTRLVDDPEGLYGDPSVAHDGTIGSVWGVGSQSGARPEFRTFDRTGKLLTATPLPPADGNWRGPYWARISPDGTKFAYEMTYEHRAGPVDGCPLTPTECANGTEVTFTTVGEVGRETPVKEIGFFRDWVDATWIDDDRLLLRRRETLDGHGIATAGGGATAVNPWSIGPGFTFYAGMVNRQHTRVALVADPFSDRILIWNATPGGQAGACFQYEDPDIAFGDPTWAPDGSALAWQEHDGIHVGTVPADCNPAAAQTRLIIPNGSAFSPYWGDGDIPGKPRPVPTVTPTPTPIPTPTPTPVPTVPPPKPTAAPTLARGALPKLRKLGRQRKLAVVLTCDGSCEMAVSATIAKSLAKRLKIKREIARSRVTGAGRLAVTLKLSARTAKKLARQKRVTVAVRATGKQASGLPAATQTTLILKR